VQRIENEAKTKKLGKMVNLGRLELCSGGPRFGARFVVRSLARGSDKAQDWLARWLGWLIQLIAAGRATWKVMVGGSVAVTIRSS
ncbi:hypothetical protein Tco_0959964, partial [Tanacetum coccineum]